MSDANTSAPDQAALSEFEFLQKVRAKMAQLYTALDAFKADLISDASDLVNVQIGALGEMVQQSKATASEPADEQRN